MLTNTDRLVEAVTYAADNSIEWWEAFDSISDALATLKGARRETADEEAIVCIMANMNLNEDWIETCTVSQAYLNLLNTMKSTLEESLEQDE
jgi:hypothetical protein